MFLTNLRVGRGHSIYFCLKFRFSYVLEQGFRLALFILGGELFWDIRNRHALAGFLCKIATVWHFGNINTTRKFVVNKQLLSAVFIYFFFVLGC